jgi:hypothetical protein
MPTALWLRAVRRTFTGTVYVAAAPVGARQLLIMTFVCCSLQMLQQLNAVYDESERLSASIIRVDAAHLSLLAACLRQS